jgi:hypothetical protein
LGDVGDAVLDQPGLVAVAEVVEVLAPVFKGWPSIPVTAHPAARHTAMPAVKGTLSARWPSVT